MGTTSSPQQGSFFAQWWASLGMAGLSRVAEQFDPARRKRANAKFLASFRALVSQWIDSGIKDGIESPLARDVRAVPSGYREPLFDVLYRWMNRNMPLPTLMNSGSIAILAQQPKYYTADERGLVKHLDPEGYAEECAIYHFQELLDTPGAHRVARCANPECRRLYLRKRLRKKEIKRGTFCADCTGEGSQARTRATREKRKRLLIAIAAEYWNEWKDAPTRSQRSSWIATRVNRRIRTQVRFQPITGRWVTQNRVGIEKEVSSSSKKC